VLPGRADALNAALDAMIESGNTLMIAAIAHPIAVAERNILKRQTAMIRQRFAPAMSEGHHSDAVGTRG